MVMLGNTKESVDEINLTSAQKMASTLHINVLNERLVAMRFFSKEQMTGNMCRSGERHQFFCCR